MAKRIPKWLRIVLCVVAALVLIFLLSSALLQHSKAATCHDLADVWQDIGALLSQKLDGKAISSHNLHTLWMYVSSNSLDGILYDWRGLKANGLIPQNTDTRFISPPVIARSLKGEAAASDAYGREVMLLRFNAYKTEFRYISVELDYTSTVTMISVEGWQLYPQGSDSAMSGYTSKVSIGTYTTVAGQENEKEEQTYCGDVAAYFDNGFSFTDPAAVAALLQDGPVFDCGISKYAG